MSLLQIANRKWHVAYRTAPFPTLSNAIFRTVKAKFHYAKWFEAGSKLVRSWSQLDRFEAGRRPASKLDSVMEFGH